MRAVFSVTITFADPARFVELVVTVGVLQAPQTLVRFFINHQVETVECVEQTMATAEWLAVESVRQGQWLYHGCSFRTI